MGALDGIRVIDFGQFVSGPATGMLLADQGAEVIKVDPPGGPVFETPANRTWNRGKRSICLDLKSGADVETARRLVHGADVLIENFRPGVMDRFGLGYESARQSNPRLIHASIPGFAATDPRATLPAWEGVVFAATDVLRPVTEYREMIQSLHRQPGEREGEPTFTSEPIASMYGALLASTAIAAALHVRSRTGLGQHIEVPLFDAMLQAIGIFALTRLPFEPIRNPIYSGWDHQYPCADGRWIHIVLIEGTTTETFSDAVGRRDWVDRGLTSPGLEARPHDNAELIEELTELFLTRSAQDWEDLFVEMQIPGAACRSSAEWLSHPQALDSDLLEAVDDPVLGAMRQPGIQVKLLDSPGGVRAAAPTVDEHREEILASLGTEVASVDADPKEAATGLPLDGLRVIDLCIVLAGPTCGRTLAELGADVIKVDPPDRSAFPYHLDVNRGKRSLLLDLRREEGREVLWRLIDDADVVVQNFRPGVMERLGFGFEAVHRRNPGAVYVSLSAYGDTGPWAHLPGYEELAEALTGMQVRFGGAEKPALWPFGVVCDYGTGYAGAYGALLALLEREESGRGQHVTSALARTACTLQSLHLQEYEGKEWTEPGGRGARGFGVLQRLYRCKDGWVFVGAKRRAELEVIVGAATPGELEAAVERWCKQQSCENAESELRKAGVGAQRLRWLVDLVAEPEVVGRGLSLSREHEALGTLRTCGPGPWYSASRVVPGCPAPLPGRDAESVLAEIGMDGEFERLVDEGVVRLPGAPEALPT